MKISGSWSVISLLRFTVQFIWAVLLVLIAGQLLMLGLFVWSGGEIGVFFPVYIDSSSLWVHLREWVGDDSAVLTSAGGIRMTFAPLGFGMLQGVLLGLLQLGLIALAFYGFTLLKRVLDAMHRTEVFTVQNGTEIRKVGILLLIAAPVKFLFEWLSGVYFNQHVVSEEISSVLPPIDYTLLFAGLICFVLAEILNQAARMYEDQKLTV